MRPRAAYSMGLIHWWARLACPGCRASPTWPRTPAPRRVAKRLGGIAPERDASHASPARRSGLVAGASSADDRAGHTRWPTPRDPVARHVHRPFPSRGRPRRGRGARGRGLRGRRARRLSCAAVGRCTTGASSARHGTCCDGQSRTCARRSGPGCRSSGSSRRCVSVFRDEAAEPASTATPTRGACADQTYR